jgi:predicted dehydrogenase
MYHWKVSHKIKVGRGKGKVVLHRLSIELTAHSKSPPLAHHLGRCRFRDESVGGDGAQVPGYSLKRQRSISPNSPFNFLSSTPRKKIKSIMPKHSHPNRRKFIKTAASAAAAFTIVPRHVLGGPGFTAPSDKVNVAAIGAGGKGRGNVNAVASQNVVALCDVDDRRAAATYSAFPEAKTYRDYRKMLDEMGKDIDAVMISTPDHTHAITGLACMALGKHVYIEKPLAHSIAEVRALTEAAAANPKLITQMGNQGASGEGIRKTQEIYEAGLLGDVHTVYAWSNRPVWPQGGPAPTVGESVPDHLDWNLWLGPAADRPYHSAYHPFAWRGYWDFGTGALGDMGCHIIDTPFYILDLGYPTEAEASVGQVFSQNWSPDYNPESCPPSTKIHIQFPARGEKPP